MEKISPSSSAETLQQCEKTNRDTQKFFLLNRIFHLNNNRQHPITNIFLYGAIVLLLYMLCTLCMESMSFTLWRHDEVMHLRSYLWKLISEGRWLNHLVFPFLQIMNPHCAILINLLCLFYFGYKCALNFTKQLSFSVLFGLSFTLVPAYYSYISWPVIMLPSFILLAALAYLSDKINSWLLLILSAFLFHGTLNYFYNMIPLLILSRESCNGFKHIAKLLIFWACCFVAGYGIALIAVKILGGQWGLTIADWRHPRVIHSLADFINNTKLIYNSFVYNTNLVGIELITFGLSCWLVCLIWNNRLQVSSYKRDFIIFILLNAVLLSSYLQGIPYGLRVYERNAFPFFFAILACALPLFNLSRLLSISFVCIMACSFYLKDYESTHYYATMVNLWSDNIKSMDSSPARINTIHLCMTDDDLDAQEQNIMKNRNLSNPLTEYLGSVGRFSTAFEDVGYYGNVTWEDSRCPGIKKKKSTQLFEYTEENHHLYLWVKE